MSDEKGKPCSIQLKDTMDITVMEDTAVTEAMGVTNREALETDGEEATSIIR